LSVPALCHGNLRELSGLTLTYLKDQQSPRRQKFPRVPEQPAVKLQTIPAACKGESRLKHSDLWLKFQEVAIRDVGRIRHERRNLTFEPMSSKRLEQITNKKPHPILDPVARRILLRDS
jgi:hypothetical protein